MEIWTGRGPSVAPFQWRTLLRRFTLAAVAFVVMAGAVQTQSVNVALNKPVSAQLTCGSFGTESYMDFSNAAKMISQRTTGTCDNTTTFPPSNMVDGNVQTKWQSTSRLNIYSASSFTSTRYASREAVIDIDLLQDFSAEQLVIRFEDALRPDWMAVSKSTDGKIYLPWFYKVSLASNCSLVKTIPASVSDTLCATYTVPEPQSFQTITFDFTTAPMEFREWKRVRFLRIEFYSMLINRMFLAAGNLFQHYAVAEVEVMAKCVCNGLQTGCEQNNVTGRFQCICGGNTQGQFCEMCLPFYNQKPFQYGVHCESCNCFNHATTCFYDAKVAKEAGSLNAKGVRDGGGGHCVGCQHDTAGVNCELCQPLFYRPVGKDQSSVDACQPCNCSTAGSTPNPASNIPADCLMNNDKSVTDGKVCRKGVNSCMPVGMTPGDCYCKANVQGSKCDTCKPGFYNLLPDNAKGCQACGCSVPGTVGGSQVCSPDQTGQCTCKTNTQGRSCDTCKDNFYNLDGNNADGCSPCDCDPGGSLSKLCDKTSGQCTCRANIEGRRCDRPRAGYFYPTLHFVVGEAETVSGTPWGSKVAGFQGPGYAVLRAEAEVQIPLTVLGGTNLAGKFAAVLRYSTKDNSAKQATIRIPSSGHSSPLTVELPACMGKWCAVATTGVRNYTLSPGPHYIIVKAVSPVLLDRAVALPLEFLTPETVLGATSKFATTCDVINNDMKLGTASEATCKQGVFSLTMFHLNGPRLCVCDAEGSNGTACQSYGGWCQCLSGVTGRKCDSCSPGHYDLTATGCKSCACAGSNMLCDHATGQCTCPPNVFGRQCDQCTIYHYGWNATLGCTACNCNLQGSSSQQCNQTSGVCVCKEGVEGDKCDTCHDGYKGFGQTAQGGMAAGCSPCNCNSVGSTGTVCNKTSSQCPCKANAVGLLCDQCAVGSFDFSSSNPKACLDCICMGVASQCSATTSVRHQTRGSLQSGSGSGLLRLVTKAGADAGVNASTSGGHMVAAMSGTLPLYWTTPADLKGDLVELYGSRIALTVRYEHTGPAGTPRLLQALLTGRGGMTLVQDLGSVQPGTNKVLTVKLREALWKVDGTSANVTRGQFLKLLTSVQSVLVPASFSSTAHTSRLVLLEYSVAGNVGVLAASVEQCACPAQYMGSSCQRCNSGFKRANVSSHEYLGVCVPCECNQHASTCDPDTGACINCQHNTAGANCEMCAVGYYGDATKGLSSDCTKCPCFAPRVANATCDSVNGTTKCSFCNPGYVGNLCDKCDTFYYGNPSILQTGTCKRCDCSGNSNSCDSLTGTCLNCSGNTEGVHCEQCISGFFGNASAQACQVCGCDTQGSNSSVCDRLTGQCPCKPGVGNRTCAGCLFGYYGYQDNSSLGCLACGCVAAGSTTAQCGATDGVCSCKPNTNGTKCDSCYAGFFGLPDRSCAGCNCNVTGTNSAAGICDMSSGQCHCKPGVTGRQCDQCMTLYTGFSESGCSTCGQCQFSLGNDTQQLGTVLEGYQATARTVGAMELQDVELQSLQAQLDSKLASLGLSGTSMSSLDAITTNLSASQNVTTAAVSDMSAQVQSLQALSGALKNQSAEEQRRVESLQNESEDLRGNASNTDQSSQTLRSVLGQHNTSASGLLNQDAVSDAGGLSYQTELSQAQADLAGIRADTGVLNMEQKVQEQRTVIMSLVSMANTIRGEMNNLSQTVQMYDNQLKKLESQQASILADQSAAKANKQTTESNMATTATVLNETEFMLRALASSQQTAQSTMTSYSAVYNGTATGLLPSTLVLPSGVSNWVSGKKALETRITAVGVHITENEPTIQAAEVYAQSAARTALAVKDKFSTVEGRGNGAVAAIQNFERVVVTLNSSVAMAQQANATVQEAQSNLAKITLLNLETSSNQSLKDSQSLLGTVNSLNYNPQVLTSQVSSANASLEQARQQWQSTLIMVNQMTNAAQQLNTLASNTAVDTQLSTATITANGAATEAQTVLNTNAERNTTLNLRQTEAATKKKEADDTVAGISQVESGLKDFKTRVNFVQRHIDFISNHRAKNRDKRTSIEATISSLEEKLRQVESRLSQLNQPTHFNGSTSVAIADPRTNIPQIHHNVDLEFRSDAGQTDAVLFFAENPASGAELSVRLAGGKVVFAFNTNVDPVMLTNPAVICSNCWARVLASRYKNVGYLSVTLLSTGGRATVTGRGQTSVEQLTLTSQLYFGSLPKTYNQSKLPTAEFRGCLKSVTFGEESVNIWGKAVSSDQQPQCCRQPSVPSSPALDPGVSFAGFGHLELPAGWLNFSATSLVVSLQFRTFSPSATLLMVSSEDHATFYRLLMRNGFVVLRYGAPGVSFEIQSRNTYNTGVWFKLTAQHGASQLTMTVVPVVSSGADHTDTGAKAASSVDLSPLSNRTVILGAANYPSVTGYAPSLNNFAGCMKELKSGLAADSLVSRSLSSGTVSSSKISLTGCAKEVLSGVALTTRQSYAELDTQQRLIQLQTLQFSLVTTQPHGILLLIKDPVTSNRDLYVALFHGNLVLRHRTSTARILTSQNLYLADGQAHSIVLDFTQSRAVMNVDGRSISETSPTLQQPYLQFSASTRLSLGGQPNAIPSDLSLPTAKSAIAGIRLLQINGKALSVFSPGILVGHSDISLSGIPSPPSSTPAPPFTTLAPPKTTPAPLCAAVPVASYQEPSAGIFLEGNEGFFSKNLTASQQGRLRSSFVLSITFAAYRGNGVVLAAASSAGSNPQQWLVVFLQDGIIHVNLRAAEPSGSLFDMSVQSTRTYNMGQKRKIDILRINKFLAFVENSQKDYSNNAGKSAEPTDFTMGSKLYVGGVNSAELVLPSAASPLTGDKQWFAGAVYQVKIDQANVPQSFFVDLQSPTSAKNVKNIYTQAHYGVSLSGVNSYIRLRDGFTVIGALNVLIGLRTTLKSANLLNMYDSLTNHIVLELSSGQIRAVLASANSGNQPFVTVTSLPVNICDNGLHNISFSLSSTGVAIQVDSLPSVTSPFPGTFTAPVISAKTLYLGGYADTALKFAEPVSRTSLRGCISLLSLQGSALDAAELVTSGQGTGYACPY